MLNVADARADYREDHGHSEEEWQAWQAWVIGRRPADLAHALIVEFRCDVDLIESLLQRDLEEREE